MPHVVIDQFCERLYGDMSLSALGVELTSWGTVLLLGSEDMLLD